MELLLLLAGGAGQASPIKVSQAQSLLDAPLTGLLEFPDGGGQGVGQRAKGLVGLAGRVGVGRCLRGLAAADQHPDTLGGGGSAHELFD